MDGSDTVGSRYSYNIAAGLHSTGVRLPLLIVNNEIVKSERPKNRICIGARENGQTFLIDPRAVGKNVVAIGKPGKPLHMVHDGIVRLKVLGRISAGHLLLQRLGVCQVQNDLRHVVKGYAPVVGLCSQERCEREQKEQAEKAKRGHLRYFFDE